MKLTISIIVLDDEFHPAANSLLECTGSDITHGDIEEMATIAATKAGEQLSSRRDKRTATEVLKASS